MKQILSLCIVLFVCSVTYAQHNIQFTIKNTERQPLAGAGAVIADLNQTSIADSLGLVVFRNIPAGNYKLTISYIGLKQTEINISVPQSNAPSEVIMEEEENEEEAVVVTATRISRTIANIPTRVEVISGEELAEKGNMKPGDIRMLLNESTGIQTQQTSATSFNSGIRIQGLDGRYTQMLRDGYPLYSGFAGGLSILQIAPLDLKQVEVIKGSASTLYGGGAIAGLVNLVSKTPVTTRELSLLANGTTAGGLDLSGFYSERYKKSGLTFFASHNSNRAFDPAAIGLTAIPKFERYTVNPRLFLYGKNSTADIGITFITEDRTGGSMNYIKNGGAGFFEKNNTDRITTQFGVAHKIDAHTTLQFKNSYSRFNRVIHIPSYTFDALQQSSFSELTWNKKGMKADWVIGANVLTEDLNEKPQPSATERDYHYNTFGLFVQNAWSVSDKVVLESGLRADYVNEYGFELLPRASVMFRVSPKITARIGGGFGYKTSTIFTEDAERMQFRNILPVNVNATQNERSAGGNFDVNYRTNLGSVNFSVNQLFYYTRLNDPLILAAASGGAMQFVNASGHLDTRGIETNLRLVYHDFKFFFGYTYTDANTHFLHVKNWLPLTARHRLNNILMFEKEDNFKIGLEAYYFSKQQLSDGSFGRSYWITGFMAEKLWKKVSVYINFENFTDTRQSKFGSIYTGSIMNPTFKDIYAPLDGFIVNGGIKLKL